MLSATPFPSRENSSHNLTPTSDNRSFSQSSSSSRQPHQLRTRNGHHAHHFNHHDIRRVLSQGNVEQVELDDEFSLRHDSNTTELNQASESRRLYQHPHTTIRPSSHLPSSSSSFNSLSSALDTNHQHVHYHLEEGDDDLNNAYTTIMIKQNHHPYQQVDQLPSLTSINTTSTTKTSTTSGNKTITTGSDGSQLLSQRRDTTVYLSSTSLDDHHYGENCSHGGHDEEEYGVHNHHPLPLQHNNNGEDDDTHHHLVMLIPPQKKSSSGGAGGTNHTQQHSQNDDHLKMEQEQQHHNILIDKYLSFEQHLLRRSDKKRDNQYRTQLELITAIDEHCDSVLHTYSWFRLFILSLMGGVYVAIGTLTSGLIASDVTSKAFQRFMIGVAFVGAFTMIIFSRSILFTEVNISVSVHLFKSDLIGIIRRSFYWVFNSIFTCCKNHMHVKIRRIKSIKLMTLLYSLRLWGIAIIGNVLGTGKCVNI